MKTVIVACIVCLLLGVGIGRYSGQRHERKKIDCQKLLAIGAMFQIGVDDL